MGGITDLVPVASYTVHRIRFGPMKAPLSLGPVPRLRAVTRPVPLAQEAYERIRRGLMLGGELDGVDRLIEQDLAARFVMSRTPIRDALHRLALMGFLEQSSGGGYVRRSFTVRDVREHYELRVLLEPVAAELAARRDPATRERGAERLLADGGLLDEAAMTRFHLAVAELSGNHVLMRVIGNVTERLVGFGIPETNPAHASDVAAAHLLIAHGIQHGDASARLTMATHLGDCERALIAQVSTWPAGRGASDPVDDDRSPVHLADDISVDR